MRSLSGLICPPGSTSASKSDGFASLARPSTFTLSPQSVLSQPLISFGVFATESTITFAPAFSRFFFGSVSSTCSKPSVARIAILLPSSCLLISSSKARHLQAPPFRCVQVQMEKARSCPALPQSNIRIGTAGWTLPKQYAQHFPSTGSHLERCAQGFNCVEVNSSFHRPHQQKIWERWARSTPPDFRFSVKLPKAITHTALLANCGGLLSGFFDQIQGLGDKLGPLLVQLPPSLAFDEGLAPDFSTPPRELHPQHLHSGFIALEPRHTSWFTPPVDRLLRSFEIARVAADPPKASSLAASPGGWNGLCYWRLHGTPRTYYSAYDAAFLRRFAAQLRQTHCGEHWVIFDNTALGHATRNALDLMNILELQCRPGH